MKKSLVYPDVTHFRSVAHLKLGKIFSLAVFFCKKVFVILLNNGVEL